MKKQILSLMLSVAVLASPASAMLENDLLDNPSTKKVAATRVPEENRIQVLSKKLAELEKRHSEESARHAALTKAHTPPPPKPYLSSSNVPHLKIYPSCRELDNSSNKLYRIMIEEEEVRNLLEIEKSREI